MRQEIINVLLKILSIAVVIGIAYLLTRLSRRLLTRSEKRFGPNLNIKFLYNVVRVVIILLAIISIGSMFTGFGRVVNTVLASSGVIALAITLAAQESLSNIVDGILLSIFKPFNVGDRITLTEKGNLTGVVSEINLRHAVITTFNNSSYIIPNKVLNEAIVENSNFGNKSYGYPIDVSVSYDCDLELAMKLLYDTIVHRPEFYDRRTPEEIAAGAPATVVLVREFGDSGIALRCTMYTHNVSESFTACSDARIALKKAFDANGIVIPYNTVTISNLPAEWAPSSPVSAPSADTGEED